MSGYSSALEGMMSTKQTSNPFKNWVYPIVVAVAVYFLMANFLALHDYHETSALQESSVLEIDMYNNFIWATCFPNDTYPYTFNYYISNPNPYKVKIHKIIYSFSWDGENETIKDTVLNPEGMEGDFTQEIFKFNIPSKEGPNKINVTIYTDKGEVHKQIKVFVRYLPPEPDDHPLEEILL